MARAAFFVLAALAFLLGLLNIVNRIQSAAEEVQTLRHSNAALLAVAAAKESQQAKLTQAIHAATQRELELSKAAARSSATVASLRQQLEQERASLPALTRDAVNQYAGAASTVFGECAVKYTELAAKADQLDSDRKTLIQAWPK